jgi:hypothetical protein
MGAADLRAAAADRAGKKGCLKRLPRAAVPSKISRFIDVRGGSSERCPPAPFVMRRKRFS